MTTFWRFLLWWIVICFIRVAPGHAGLQGLSHVNPSSGSWCEADGFLQGTLLGPVLTSQLPTPALSPPHGPPQDTGGPNYCPTTSFTLLIRHASSPTPLRKKNTALFPSVTETVKHFPPILTPPPRRVCVSSYPSPAPFRIVLETHQAFLPAKGKEAPVIATPVRENPVMCDRKLTVPPLKAIRLGCLLEGGAERG